MILPMVFASIITGVLTARIGYYTPFMLVGNCLMAIGAGLLTTLEVDTGKGKWIGYQILYGFGLGSMFQAPNLAAQTVLPNRDVPVGTSLMFFSQLLGGAIFISVGQNVLNSQLLTRLSALPGFNPDLITGSGATGLIQRLPAEIRAQVLTAYNEALRRVFQVAVAMACLAIFGGLAMEWRSVKKNVQPKDRSAESEAEDGKAAAVDGGAPAEKAASVSEDKRVDAADEVPVDKTALEKERAS